MCDFFRCAACLVLTIYDLLLASILGVRGRLASVAYPFIYTQECVFPSQLHNN
jgi:hypothetical protein